MLTNALTDNLYSACIEIRGMEKNLGGPPVTQRIATLDGLRGVAALSVAFAHSGAVYAHPKLTLGTSIWGIVSQSVFSANEAVVLFFILSGYVLAKSLSSEDDLTQEAIWSFYIKRCFRILPAMWVAIIVTFIISRAYDLSDKQNLFSGWYHHVFAVQGGWQVLSNFALRSFDVVPNTWTMRIEMIGSLFTPLFFWILSIGNWYSRIATGIAVLAVGFAYGGDFSYMLAFFVGAVLAKSDTSAGASRWFIVAGLLAVSACNLAPGAWHGKGFEPIFLTAGGALILLGCRDWALLASSPFRRFGQISYSFYLYHSTVLAVIATATLPFLKRLDSTLANFMLFGASAIMTVPVATLSYRFVENRFRVRAPTAPDPSYELRAIAGE